jgi:transaldolase
VASPSACGRSSTGFHNIINLLTAKPKLPAISAVVADGMTVNVTLTISVERYAAVMSTSLHRGLVKGAVTIPSTASARASRHASTTNR